MSVCAGVCILLLPVHDAPHSAIVLTGCRTLRAVLTSVRRIRWGYCPVSKVVWATVCCVAPHFLSCPRSVCCAGMIRDVHYIAARPDTLVATLQWWLSDDAAAALRQLTLAGQQLVLSRHMIEHRAAEFDAGISRALNG